MRQAFRRKLTRRVAAMLPLGLGLWWLATLEDEEGNPRQAHPWQVRAYGALPLKMASRVWGHVNSIDLPENLREPSFKFYAWLFGVNLDEMKDPDLSHYKNLSEFFYRELKPDARPIANSLLVSPCDGKMLQFGTLVDNSRIEKVKGVSYTLDSFLGSKNTRKVDISTPKNGIEVERHQAFARMNGISYTVDEMVGDENHDVKDIGDMAYESPRIVPPEDLLIPYSSPGAASKMHYCVIYLAPGDYHRFHSPASWVAQVRRHYIGELFSVAPYFQSRMANLFCINERVAILGRWRHGFFSMTPVGATNVGSIAINFDSHLRTNSRYDVEGVRHQKSDCYEATYRSASPLLHGYPLVRGDEIGGFKLGSTVVLIFEAPANFEFKVGEGETVKMGQALGDIDKSQ